MKLRPQRENRPLTGEEAGILQADPDDNDWRKILENSNNPNDTGNHLLGDFTWDEMKKMTATELEDRRANPRFPAPKERFFAWPHNVWYVVSLLQRSEFGVH